jgi:hypothetical protein
MHVSAAAGGIQAFQNRYAVAAGAEADGGGQAAEATADYDRMGAWIVGVGRVDMCHAPKRKPKLTLCASPEMRKLGEGKVFFFEKKKQKTFFRLSRTPG